LETITDLGVAARFVQNRTLRQISERLSVLAGLAARRWSFWSATRPRLACPMRAVRTPRWGGLPCPAHSDVVARQSGLSLISAERLRETPNNTSAAGGIGGCGIILDVGATENGLRR